MVAWQGGDGIGELPCLAPCHGPVGDYKLVMTLVVDVCSYVLVLCYSAFASYDVCISHRVYLVDLLHIIRLRRCSTSRWCGGGSFCTGV